MDRLSLLISFAIGWLALSYVLFTSQQYFSVGATLIIFLIAIAACLVFVLCYRYSRSGVLVLDMRRDRQMVVFIIIISALSIYEAVFNSPGPSIFGSLAPVFLLAGAGVLVSMCGLYLIKKMTKNPKSYGFYIRVIIISMIIAGLAYWVIYGIRNVNWNGIDELGYNYYASYLLAHGTNPYLASMQPILQQRNIYPTVQLNGTFEYAYDYPALSFLPYVFLPLLGITNFFAFIIIVIFLSIIAAFLVYYKSGYNKFVLIPIAVWLFATYTLVGTMNQYLSVSVLFLIAYLERKNVVLSGILLGLAASIIQLVWFAIPFLYILVYREYGGKQLAKCLGYTLLAFLVVNAYFIVLSPKVFITNVFAVFGLTKLAFYGPNIMQLLVSHYRVPSWYSAGMSIVTLFVMFGLFYLYTDTLKPLLAVVPASIFFLSWRNISIYGLPFIPIILAIYYVGSKDKRVEDILSNKKPILYVVVLLAIAFATIAILSHGPYIKENLLEISSITPILYGQPGFVGPFSLGGIRVAVINNANYTQPVSFFVVSRSPNGQEYILSPSINSTLTAHSSSNYTLNYQLPGVANSTKIYIFAFSQDYITAKQYQINLAR